jgi:RimJ/RimL family protein N-acetyltransferase
MLIQAERVELKNGEIVLLKSPESSDAEKLLRHLKRVFGESYRNMNHPPSYWDNFPVADEEKILADFAASPSKFMVSAFSDDRIVGNLGIFGSPGEFLKHNARLGMGIEKAFCGIGLGSALIQKALRHARDVNFHRIELTVRSFNDAGIKLYEKTGFERVGLLKDAAFIDGRYYDEYMYQILLGKEGGGR